MVLGMPSEILIDYKHTQVFVMIIVVVADAVPDSTQLWTYNATRRTKVGEGLLECLSV